MLIWREWNSHAETSSKRVKPTRERAKLFKWLRQMWPTKSCGLRFSTHARSAKCWVVQLIAPLTDTPFFFHKATTMTSRRPIILAFFFVITSWFAATGLGQQAAAPARTGRLVEVKIPAPSLKGNLLGDPTEQTIAVYLPPSYEASPTKRFPSLDLLHGFTAKHQAWTTNGYQGMSLQPLMDEMIKSGKVQEMIVVAPNGWNAYKGAFYTNSSVNGNWEDYIYRDLVQTVDAKYRTVARPESRGIAGHSMGGYGALTLAMKHPDVFGAVYALSPCCLGIEGDFTEDNPGWMKALRLH